MPLSYFEQLSQDFSSMELSSDPLVVADMPGLYELLESVEAIGPAGLAADVAKNLRPKTVLGQRTLQLITKGPGRTSFPSVTYMSGCSWAELKLIESLEPDEIASPRSYAPIIVTKNDRPAGIIKTQGEKSCYALATEIKVGLLEAVFAEPLTSGMVAKAGLSSRPWSLPLEAAGQFAPMRFSIYAVPASERLKLIDDAYHQDERRVLATSHAQIMERARELLADAVPLELVPDAIAA